MSSLYLTSVGGALLSAWRAYTRKRWRPEGRILPMRDEITPIVLAHNEEANLGRSLEKLRWASEVVVVDSGSTDGTHAIATAFSNVRLVVHPFATHAAQWNFAVHGTGIQTDWVMALDADYVLSDDIVSEIAALRPAREVSGYEVSFLYRINGTPLRRSLYPPLTVLFRRSCGVYEEHGHRMVLRLEGLRKRLNNVVEHDDRKSYARWLASQRRYAALEAQRLRTLPLGELRKRDWVRRAVIVAPWLVPTYCLVGLGLWRDGRAGIRYAFERGLAELLIARELLRPQPSTDLGEDDERS